MSATGGDAVVVSDIRKSYGELQAVAGRRTVGLALLRASRGAVRLPEQLGGLVDGHLCLGRVAAVAGIAHARTIGPAARCPLEVVFVTRS